MNRDLATRLLELAGTGLEGMEHARDQIGSGNYEKFMSVFTDVVHAFSEIEGVLRSTYQPEQGSDDLLSVTDSLRDGFDWMVKAYEERGRLQEIMQLTLIARYREWLKELGQSLSRYIMSS